MEKAKFFRPTVYLDANNQKVISNAEDLSNVQSKVILEIGYFKDKHSGEIRVPRMPIDVRTVPDYLPPQITSLENMFRNCLAFNQDLSSWDVSNIKNMKGVFSSNYLFNNGGQPLSWSAKTRNVTTMERMFENTAKFNQDISNWDVSNVKNIGHMFLHATSFNNNSKPLNWDAKTKNMEIMDSAFNHAKAFNKDITNWNTAKVNNMRFMFYRAASFNQDLSRWNVANVTRYEGFANNPEKWPQFKK